jgi:oxaloacetate decarboxylase alpha subunit
MVRRDRSGEEERAEDGFAHLLERDTRDLLRLIEDTSLTELLVETGGGRIHLLREVVSEPPAGTVPEELPTVAGPVEASLHTVTAQTVGNFYLLTDQDPALTPGHRIAVGDQLGNIESMRVLHEVHAEEAGEIVEVLVRDGQPVEYGQPLFVLRVDPDDGGA